MDRNMPPGAKVLGEIKTSKSHNKEQYMENSMKDRGYDVSAKDLENGYVETAKIPKEMKGRFVYGIGFPNLEG